MLTEFKIADEKHVSKKEQWKAAFQIPALGREGVFGYAAEVDAIIVALRGNLFAKRARVPFEIARSVQGGLFLSGPPGCGKTHLVSAAAGALKVPILIVQPAHILADHAGSTGHVLSALFEAGMEIAQERGGAILFFDELEAYGRRTPKMEGFEVTLSNLLKFVDRATTAPEGSRLVIAAATNNPASCEPALLSRLSTHMEIGHPNADSRRAYLSAAIEGAIAGGFCDESIDVEEMVRASDGLTLRQIAQALDGINAQWIGAQTSPIAKLSQVMLTEALAKKLVAKPQPRGRDPAFL